jgi:hemerythrin
MHFRTRKEWKGSFTAGTEELDARHRGLLDLINETGDLDDVQKTLKSTSFGALNGMIRYAENHFRTEEGYFSKKRKGTHQTKVRIQWIPQMVTSYIAFYQNPSLC